MLTNLNTVGGCMHYSTRTTSLVDHYRLQAIQARQRATQALDQAPVKVAFEEVANHWIALAEQVEGLERNSRRMTGFRAKATTTGRILLSSAALGLVGFALLVVIGLSNRYPLEAETFGFSGIFERAWQTQASQITAVIEE
jgi:ABC-type uncharacterized transport system permease subunit